MAIEKQRELAGGVEQVDPAFEEAYARMMEKAVAESRGERKRRLLEQHGHAEKMLAARVWWPAIGSLEHLHPEWEVRDMRGGVNFADYGYVPARSFALLLECDGFGPHWRDISRWQFDRDLERQNLLWIDDWRMLRFSYDAIMDKAERCRQTLLLALAKWGQKYKGRDEAVPLNVYERAILHFFQSFSGDWASPALLCKELSVSFNTLSPHLQSLVEKGIVHSRYSPTGKKMGYRFMTLK